MNLMTLLEQLATNTHHQIEVQELMNNQSSDIQQAFLTNNAAIIKNQWPCKSVTANKSVVVQVTCK